MVEETNFQGKIVFKCSKCGWLYKDEDMALKCQDWCEKHNTCNLAITKNAIKMKLIIK